MIVKESPLILNEFLLLNSSYEFIEPKAENGIDINDVYKKYLVDIDYSIQGDENNANIFVKVEVNNAEDKKCGYSLIFEGVGIFGFNEDSDLNKEEKGNLIFYSAISICISNLRAIIANITAYGPFGRYTLPSIDLNHLIASKSEKNGNKEQKE